MGQALRRNAEAHRGGRRTVARVVVALVALAATPAAALQAQHAPVRLDSGRFTVVAYPQDLTLAHAVLAHAANDTFPGLPTPHERVLIAIAPDHGRFRDWVGPTAPEWGAAIAVPSDHRIVMQGSDAPSSAGDPMQVLHHELAHLALHEYLGDLPPRWFDEGYASYAAGEWGRDEILATNVALVMRGVPSLDSLDAEFDGGAAQADAAYALSYRAVAEMAALDPQRGLSLFFDYWKRTGSMDAALRRAYGITEAAFDQRWRDHTMRRFGVLSLLANVSVACALIGILVVPVYVVRRRRDRQRLAELRAEEEAAERAERESAIAALLGEPPASQPDARPPVI